MSDREISLKSIIFLIIGILLVLSLVICIYLVNSEKDLVKISATVTSVKEDSDGTGKNDITVSYNINNIYYDYSFNYKDDIKINDKVDIYYHEKEPISVQAYKTSKVIFVCPVVGLVLCIVGLIELTRKSNAKNLEEDDDFETKVISVNGDMQQLKIITGDKDDEILTYMEESDEETSVKLINTHNIPVIEEELPIEIPSKKVEPIDFNEPSSKKTKIKKVTPVDYYINNNALVYKDGNDDYQEFALDEIEKVIKKVNDNDDEIINIIIYTKNMKCTLNKIKNVDLANINNLLHNKLLSINKDYVEEVEHKQY